MPTISAAGLRDATIGIVCALPKEFSAVRAVFECATDPTSELNSAGRKYAVAQLAAVGGGRHVVAIALLPEMGNNSAAIRATNLLNDCPNIAYILMVGIAGAIPHPEKAESHVRLGDIVVCDRHGVVQYDLVKEAADGSVEHRNPPRAPSSRLLELVNWLRSNEDLGTRPWESFIELAAERLGAAWKRPAESEDVLDDSEAGNSPVTHPNDPDRRPGQPRVFHGPIAAANVLLKNTEKRNDLRTRFGVKAVEMEGSGIADAARDAQVDYLVVRGTCDYCNSNKNDAWQKYAAVIAAAYARALISSIPVSQGTSAAKADLGIPELQGAPATQSDSRFFYEKGFEHGRLAEQLTVAPSADELRSPTDSRMLEGVKQSLQASAGGNALSSPAALDELERKLRLIRGHLDTYDHDLAREIARDIERILAEDTSLITGPSRKAAFELLTDVAIIEFKRHREENVPGASGARARAFLAGAIEASEGSETEDEWRIATAAYLDSLEQGAEAGLGLLEGRNDPQATRRKLAILIDHERFAEAAEVARHRTPEREWCEKAVSAFIQVGEISRAKELIRWAGTLEDRTPRRRSILCYAESRLVAAFSRRGEDEAAIPGSLDEAEREAVQDVVETLTPILQVAGGNERVVDALEEHAVRLALHSRILLGDRDGSESLATLLATRRPVPLSLAPLVLGANLPIPTDLARRLREDHPRSFEASRLAILLDAKDPEKLPDAFEMALKVESESLRKDERKRHFYTLYSLARELGEDAMKRVERLAPGLLAADVDSLKLFLADRFLISDRTEAAREILEEIHAEDDPRWLQLYAQLMDRSGEPDAAMQRLIQASRKVPEADLFRQIARIAHGLGRFDIVAEVLQKVVALDPTDVRSRINLAGALTKVADPDGAAEQFCILREADPGDPWHALNQAASLAHAGHLERALVVYEECCRAPNPILEALMGRAEALRLDDKAAQGFRSLDDVKSAWWDESRFVKLYMAIAYAAGMDRQASLALGQLMELHRTGAAGDEIVTTIPLDELKKRFVDRRAHDDEFGGLLLRGHVPWIMVEEGRRRVPYLGWSIRTQPLSWCPDDPQGRAELSLYATNGFFVVDDGSAGKEIIRIECPDPGAPVAIDISALFTLHALDLLEVAAEYFGRIMVPAVYLEQVLEDRSRLLPHQLSQKTSLEQVRSAIAAGRIRVAPDSSVGAGERLPIVDEYSDETPTGVTLYRALEAIEPLYAHGRVTRDDFERAEQAFSRQRRSGALPPALFARLDVDLFTLLTLARIGCLDPLVDSFRVGISRMAEAEVARGIREFAFREKVRSSHTDLWTRVRANPKYVIKPAVPPRRLGRGSSEELPDAGLTLGASWIAAHEGIPLLADDRVIQVVTQNEVGGLESGSFGTDRLIEKLQAFGAISADRSIDAILQLMRWRYRFLLPSAELLKRLLDRYRENPPGLGLRDLAEYVHDCMRDPGLFSGFEPTSPPVSMASSLHQGWITAVVQFVMKIWDDETWSDAGARAVTRWAIRQLLPSLPATMPGPLQGVLARLEHRIIISMALIASAVVVRPERANAGLLAIAEELGMREGDLYETLADVIAERT